MTRSTQTGARCPESRTRSESGRVARGRLFGIGLALLLGALPAAAQMPALVAGMLDNGLADAEQRCAYTRFTDSDSGTRTERFDPALPGDPWTLLSMDGAPPTPEELQRYARKAEERADRRHPLAFDLRSMVDPEGWQLRAETHAEAVFEFRLRPNEDLGERLVDKVRGTLVVDRQRQQPVHIRIENVEPAYVAPLVRIARYAQDLRFRWEEQLGVSVLANVETHRRGRALGLKSLHQDKQVRYFDYECRR